MMQQRMSIKNGIVNRLKIKNVFKNDDMKRHICADATQSLLSRILYLCNRSISAYAKLIYLYVVYTVYINCIYQSIERWLILRFE